MILQSNKVRAGPSNLRPYTISASTLKLLSERLPVTKDDPNGLRAKVRLLESDMLRQDAKCQADVSVLFLSVVTTRRF